MLFRCGVAQLVDQRAHNPKVAGSSPAPATKVCEYDGASDDLCYPGGRTLFGSIAQLVEQRFHTALVAGSSPATSTRPGDCMKIKKPRAPRNYVDLALRQRSGFGAHRKTEKTERRDRKIQLKQGKEVFQSLRFR